MKKRVLAAAALMLCIASAALAGGKETAEYFRKPDGESATDPYVYGENMPGVYTYGGSKRDWINGMAVGPDGRIAITGYTESSDGTLSDRTKTWRAGWVMMLDEHMHVQWNFCSRSGDADHMRYPVFHEDGTLTAVHYTEGKQIKIIRLNTGGERIAGKTVLTEYAEDENIYPVGVLDAGYLMQHAENYGEKSTYLLYDWEGNQLAFYEGMTVGDAVGGKHLLRRTQEGIELCSIDAKGTLTPLSCVAKKERDGSIARIYEDIISLGDGGAAACGRIWKESTANTEGLLSRWDAQGNLVFEMIVPLGELIRLVRTENGFAAACIAVDDLQALHRWQLLEFDEAGMMCGRHALCEERSLTACALAAADGMLLCAQSVGEYMLEDVRLTVRK